MARSKARRVVLWLVAATPLLAACNVIVGLSSLDKTECPGGGTCDVGTSSSSSSGGGFDAGDGGGQDARPNPVDAQGTVPVSWAKFVMPNYKQDDFDAEVPNVPTYSPQSDNDAGLVDSVSQLVWRPVPAAEKQVYTFDEATKLCASAKNGPWRLPTRIELVTLLDFTPGATGATAATEFGLEKTKKYWTTSFYRVTAGPTSAPTDDRLVVGFDGAATNVISRAKETDKSQGAICIQAR